MTLSPVDGAQQNFNVTPAVHSQHLLSCANTHAHNEHHSFCMSLADGRIMQHVLWTGLEYLFPACLSILIVNSLRRHKPSDTAKAIRQNR